MPTVLSTRRVVEEKIWTLLENITLFNEDELIEFYKTREISKSISKHLDEDLDAVWRQEIIEYRDIDKMVEVLNEFGDDTLKETYYIVETKCLGIYACLTDKY